MNTLERTATAYGEYNAGRIVQARHLEGMTQKELSERSHISQSKLSKLQNGFIVFKEPEAKAIADALGFPMSYFTCAGPILPMTAVTYRKTSKTSMGELSAVSIEYSELCATVARLAGILGMSDRKNAWIEKIAPHKQDLSNSEIDVIASQARAYMGLDPTGPIGNLTRSLERQGIVVAPMKSTRRFDNEKTRLTSEGITYPQYRGMPCIGYSAGRRVSGDRQRFTKAHELGHLVLHRFRKPDTPQQIEREAHLFAGALLLPADDMQRAIRGHATLSDFLTVKSGWGVSIAASIARARTLDIISAERYQSLQIQLSNRGWRKQEPVNVGEEHPLLLKQMIQAVFGAGSSINGERAVKSIDAANTLAFPFRYLDCWSDGLIEEGAELGFTEERISVDDDDAPHDNRRRRALAS